MDPADVVAESLVQALRLQVPPTFPLVGIDVHLGALVDLVPAALLAALRARLPGIDVQITVIAALMRCEDCGAEYPPDEHPCPACGSPRGTLIHGEELAVVRARGAEDTR